MLRFCSLPTRPGTTVIHLCQPVLPITSTAFLISVKNSCLFYKLPEANIGFFPIYFMSYKNTHADAILFQNRGHGHLFFYRSIAHAIIFKSRKALICHKLKLTGSSPAECLNIPIWGAKLSLNGLTCELSDFKCLSRKRTQQSSGECSNSEFCINERLFMILIYKELDRPPVNSCKSPQ